MSRGRNGARRRIIARAASRMASRLSVRAAPSNRRAQRLDLVADFDVAGQVGRLDPALADPLGGLLLGRVVLRLLAGVHQPGGFPGDLPPQFRAIHQASAVSPSDRRAGI